MWLMVWVKQKNRQVKLNVGVLGGFSVCILNPDLHSICTKPVYTKQYNFVYVIIYTTRITKVFKKYAWDFELYK